MSNPGELIKVEILFPEESVVSSETLWARFIGNGLVKIENIPALARAVSLNDTVKINDNNEVIEIVEKAANTKLVRWIPGSNSLEEKALWMIVRRHFKRYEIPTEHETHGAALAAVPLWIDDEKLDEICQSCPVKVMNEDDDENPSEDI